MAILRRILQADTSFNRQMTAEKKLEHLLPSGIFRLFTNALPMGTIMPRRQFFVDVLPNYEKERVRVNGFEYSVRPAWTAYRSSPQTHLIIIGHILICHILKNEVFYCQPSVRLFDEDTKTRIKNFELLLQRVNHYKGWHNAIAGKKVTA